MKGIYLNICEHMCVHARCIAEISQHMKRRHENVLRYVNSKNLETFYGCFLLLLNSSLMSTRRA